MNINNYISGNDRVSPAVALQEFPQQNGEYISLLAAALAVTMH
jgi:hypothetical protein